MRQIYKKTHCCSQCLPHVSPPNAELYRAGCRFIKPIHYGAICHLRTIDRSAPLCLLSDTAGRVPWREIERLGSFLEAYVVVTLSFESTMPIIDSTYVDEHGQD